MDKNKEVKVMFKDKCFATYNFSVFEDLYDVDEVYVLLAETFDRLLDLVTENEYEKIEDDAIKEIWKGNEDIKEIEEKSRQESKEKYVDLLEQQDYVFDIMKKALTVEQYRIWEELHIKEVDISNQIFELYTSGFSFRRNGRVSDHPFI